MIEVTFYGDYVDTNKNKPPRLIEANSLYLSEGFVVLERYLPGQLDWPATITFVEALRLDTIQSMRQV